MRPLLASVAFAVLASPSFATDFQALRADPEISTGLRWIAAADAIRDNCPTIEERTWTAFNTARRLLSRASDLGYSFGEAKEYVDSSTEQARVRAEAAAYLAQVGVVEGDAQTYCAAGVAEIERSSAIGVLIKVN